MRSSWRTIVAGLVLALGAAVSALVPPAHAAGITIAIDPGHGGSDPGAVANGLREKDLTLAVSLALKEELESYDGVRVVMTRTTDTRPSENTSEGRRGLVRKLFLVQLRHPHAGTYPVQRHPEAAHQPRAG